MGVGPAWHALFVSASRCCSRPHGHLYTYWLAAADEKHKEPCLSYMPLSGAGMSLHTS